MAATSLIASSASANAIRNEHGVVPSTKVLYRAGQCCGSQSGTVCQCAGKGIHAFSAKKLSPFLRANPFRELLAVKGSLCRKVRAPLTAAGRSEYLSSMKEWGSLERLRDITFSRAATPGSSDFNYSADALFPKEEMIVLLF